MMKKLLISLFAFALAGSVLSAQQKILTIDMGECFDSFHETAGVIESMENLKQNLEADIAEREQALRGKAEPIQERLMEIQENPGLSDQAKQAQMAEMQAEILPLQQEEQELRQYVQQKEAEYQQQFMQRRQRIIDKIKSQAQTIAIREGATILLDTADTSGSGVATVIYSEPNLDITSRVIRELNRNAGADAGTEEAVAE